MVSCLGFLQDYETDLASYTSGLETLLNIPIKRTMLKSPSMDLNQEVTCYFHMFKEIYVFKNKMTLHLNLFLCQASQLQTRYMELFTLSGDYYKFLGQLLKNMEELKVCGYLFFFNLTS